MNMADKIIRNFSLKYTAKFPMYLFNKNVYNYKISIQKWYSLGENSLYMLRMIDFEYLNVL